MELNFDRVTVSCLAPAIREVQNSEQTQEIRLTDGMPDVGHVVSSWGQVILRGKEWRSDRISFSGGVMVWVLYVPEDGGAAQCMDTWIPFTMNWELPDGVPEGEIRIRCLPRFVDARYVSPSKILVRAGVAAMAEAFVPTTAELSQPQKVPEGVELLRRSYPVRLYQEAGEKVFTQDEELNLPDSVPQPEDLISYRFNPSVSDRKVLADKIVFRGNSNLHVLYRSEEGQLHSWDFDLPFSQFAELDREHGSEAAVDLVLCPTNLELELTGEGVFRFKGNVTAQYAVSDKQQLEVVEDAYSPTREIEQKMTMLSLPILLENRRETLHAQQPISADVNISVETVFMPDFPRIRKTENGMEMDQHGVFQTLSYGENGALQGASARWEGQQPLRWEEDEEIIAAPLAVDAQSAIGNGQMIAKAEVSLDIYGISHQKIPVVTGITLGEARKADPSRPTLILRRAGKQRLWDLAKDNSSTVEDIRRVNQLQDEPAPEQMLLIPVKG